MKKNKFYFLLGTICLILLTCSTIILFSKALQPNSNQIIAEEIEQITTESSAQDEILKEEITINQEQDNMVKTILQNMSLEEKICQMLFVTPEALTGYGEVFAAGESTKQALNKYPVGGLIYFAPNLKNREQVIEMLSNTQEFSKIPLFLGVDEEGGVVARIGNNEALGTTKIPAMQIIGSQNDSQKAYQVGETIGREIQELGFNLDFAPVADVVIDTSSQEIGSRSFGSEPDLVSNMVTEFVKGLQNTQVCAVLKHFPGHGSALVDSHSGRSEVNKTLAEFKAVDFPPFLAGIQAGADFVLVSHITAVNLTSDNKPASLSSEIITNILKQDLGFKGIVITDSLSMGAITEYYSVADTAVLAVQAGNDMLLMPPNLDKAIQGIKSAIEQGQLTEARIDESVFKILKLKLKTGLWEK